MVVIAPRPMLLGVFHYPVRSASEWIVKTIPPGAWWRLKYLLIAFPVLFEGDAVASTRLGYELFDADGRAFSVRPIAVDQVLTPGSFPDLAGTQLINVDYPGGSNVKLHITALHNTATFPDWVSVTFYGMRGWEGYGRSGGGARG